MFFSFPPEFQFFGIYFPSILLISLFGIITAVICRKLITAFGLERFFWHKRLAFLSAAAGFSAIVFILF